MMLQQMADGTVLLHGAKTYSTTVAEHPLDELPAGITSRVYNQGRYHAFKQGDDVVDGGPMPWPEGDDLLAQTDDLIREKEQAEAATAAARQAEYDAAIADAQSKIASQMEAAAAATTAAANKANP